MKQILSILSLLVGGLAFADVPNTFQAGDAIKASEMNENFTSITNEVDSLTTKTANYSDIESDVASLKAKVELLESLLSSDDTASATAEYVGVSSAATTGNGGGLSGMNQMCDDTYPGSRMCTTKDIVSNGFPSSIPFNQGEYGYARVHNDSNILAVTLINSGKNYFQYEGWIPREDHGDDKCLEWRLDNSSYSHSVIVHHINNVPRPSNTSCADQIPNACCK